MEINPDDFQVHVYEDPKGSNRWHVRLILQDGKAENILKNHKFKDSYKQANAEHYLRMLKLKNRE
jgi:hypothetical protein